MEDATGAMNIMIFDKPAQKLVGVSAQQRSPLVRLQAKKFLLPSVRTRAAPILNDDQVG